AAGRCIDPANRRAAARSEAETVICRPQLAVLGIQKVGRGRTVSRVLCPLRDGDHLSWTPVARRLQRPIPEGSASSLIPRRGRPPTWSCSGRGLPGRQVALPPVGSYPTVSPLPREPL